MPAISAIFLIVSLILAVVIGPQTRDWTWGPAMLSLGISVLAALPVIWKRGIASLNFGLLTFGTLTAAWFAWRAWMSPVKELGQADLLLLAGVVGAFVSVRAIAGNLAAERVLNWGIALLLLASVVVIGKQLVDPNYSPVFRQKSIKLPTGFYGHYNECANYLIASSMLVGAASLFGRYARPTRILLGLLAITGLAAVWTTNSRGGVFGAAAACGVFTAALLVIGKRSNAKWFAPVLIAIPVFVLGISVFFFTGWQRIQELRHTGGSIENLLDDNSRLYFLGIAMSCIGLHPLAGGGSRSFSWECFRFAEGKAQGDIITHKPEMVHNELMQSFTDYGLIGAGLLIGLLVTLALMAVFRLSFEEKTSGEPDHRDAWRLGALAALAGILTQSCFSFVFHVMPNILLLGICLGQLSRPSQQSPATPRKTLGSRILLTAAAVSCVALLLPFGWRGLRVTKTLWPAYFSKQYVTSAESKIDALSEAIRLWPQSTFHNDRANALHELANSNNKAGFKEFAEQAIDDYQQTSRLNPFDPGPVINQANLLSELNRDAEAEAAYTHGISLQGGMEPAFRGYFSETSHYLHKAARLFDPANPKPAQQALELAAQKMETTCKNMHWIISELIEPRVEVHESLGTAREAVGDQKGALESYDFASNLQGGTRVHYRAGVLLGKMAVEVWNKRQASRAMGLFMEARKRVGQAGNELPAGITPSQRIAYVAYLDQQIAFLKGAKVEPEEVNAETLK